MNGRGILRLVGWLTRDTFRQALETRVLWLMLGLSVVAVATCASVGVRGDATIHHADDRPDFLPRNDPDVNKSTRVRDGVDVPSGTLTLAFGAIELPLARDRRDAVHFLQAVLAAGLAGVAGLFLTLVWTAGFLPDFLAPRPAALLLSKPTPRSALFLAKCAGILLFVGAQTAVLVGGTWVALGARTGIWDTAYLWCIPLLALQFAVFFTVSALIAAHLRGASACVLGALLFWALCWGMNFGRHAVVSLPHRAPHVGKTTPLLGAVVETGYWILPKPADLGIVLADLVGATQYSDSVPEFESVRRHHQLHVGPSVVSSLLSAGLLLTVAVRRFSTVDY